MDPSIVQSRGRGVADENSAAFVHKQRQDAAAKTAKRVALQTVTNTAATRGPLGPPLGVPSGFPSAIAVGSSGTDRRMARPRPNSLRSVQESLHTISGGPMQPESTNMPVNIGPTIQPQPQLHSDDTIDEASVEDEDEDDVDDGVQDGSMDFDESMIEHPAAHMLDMDADLGSCVASRLDSDADEVAGVGDEALCSDDFVDAEAAEAAEVAEGTSMISPYCSLLRRTAQRFYSVKALTNPHAVFPPVSDESRTAFRLAADEVAATPGLLDERDEDWYDVGMVCEYGAEIFAHMRQKELELLPDHDYMDRQSELNWQLRRVLVDWLVQVHHRFNLLPETLFLTINYMDRFMTVKDVAMSKFQLVGAVALFLAAKYEEINYLSVQEVTAMVESQYPADEILKAERYMVDLLDFNLGFPGPMSFLRRASKADDYDLESRTLAKYLLEITIIDERFVAAPPSWTAAIALYLARIMLQRGDWTERHVYFSGYTEDQLMPGVDVIREAIENAAEHHRAIFEKYSERKFRKAALYVRDWVRRCS